MSKHDELLPDGTSGTEITVRHRRANNGLALIAAVCALAALVTTSVGTIVVLSNTGKIERNERDDVNRIETALFRICKRERDGRAELHASAFENRLRDDGRTLLKKRQARIPLVDCTPNLHGSGAIKLSRDEQTRFIKFFVANDRAPCVLKARVRVPRPLQDNGRPVPC